MPGGPLTQAYVDSLFEVSHPLGSQYIGKWLDTSTFRIEVENAWLPQPQINGTYTTRLWLKPSPPLYSADRSTPVDGVSEVFSKRLTGSLGTHARPRLVSVVGSDPDNGDDQFSNGDIITFTFDMPTHIGQMAISGDIDPYRPVDPGASGGGPTITMEGVNALFRFDFYQPAQAAARVPSLGLDYTGRWTDDSTFVLTIVNSIRRVGRDSQNRIWNRMPRLTDDAYMANNYQGQDSIWVDVPGDVRSIGLQSPRCTDRVPLTGTWGNRNEAPQLLRLFGTDPDNSNSLPTAGDTLTFVFDRRTSKGRTARPPPPDPGTQRYADFFLQFTPPIGRPCDNQVCHNDYTAVFRDDSTFVLTLHRSACTIAHVEGLLPENTPVGMCELGVEPYVLGTVLIKPQAQLKSAAASFDPANDLVDFNEFDPFIWGQPGAPELLSFVVSDYDNFNTRWSGGDVIRVAFDRATYDGNQQMSGNKAYIDAIFHFDHWLGDDYSGQWVESSIFEITAIDVNVVRPDVGRTEVFSSRMILNAAATARGVERRATITGNFGAGTIGPQLVAYEAMDDMVTSDGATPGDTVELRFNMRTDLGGGRPVNEIFTFTPPLPPDVGLRWKDAATFEIRIGPSGAGPERNLLVGASRVMLIAGAIRGQQVANNYFGQPSPLSTYNFEQNYTLTGTFGTADPPKLVGFIAADPMNADQSLWRWRSVHAIL